MGKNIIVSEETVRDLLEAHASLSAWYYELSAGLRAAGGTAKSPDEATRSAFVERLASDFPEVAAVARSIKVPRMFVPPPPVFASPRPLEEPTEEQSTLIEPAQQRFRESGSGPAVQPDGAPPAVPPAIVVPTKVKYEP